MISPDPVPPTGLCVYNGRPCLSTGRVLIGMLHQRPLQPGSEAERVQAVLLDRRSPLAVDQLYVLTNFVRTTASPSSSS